MLKIKSVLKLVAVLGLAYVATPAIASDIIECRYDTVHYKCIDPKVEMLEITLEGNEGSVVIEIPAHVAVTCENWVCKNDAGEYYGSGYSGYDYIVQKDHLIVVTTSGGAIARPFSETLQAELLHYTPYMDQLTRNGFDDSSVPQPPGHNSDPAADTLTIYEVICHPVKDTCIYNGEYIEKTELPNYVPFANVPTPEGDGWYCEEEMCYLSSHDGIGTNPFWSGFDM